MPKIVFVCRDVGGADTLLPVGELLKGKNEIRWIAQENGRGKDVLKNSGQDFELYSFSKIISGNLADVIVSSTCSGAGQDLARSFKGFCPIVVIQDQWTAGLYDVWVDSEHRPDYILVNDGLDGELVSRAWPDFKSGEIIITGYPALDKYANFDVQGTRARVKNVLSLSDDKPVILFTGQWQQTGHAITEIVRVLNELGRDVYLIARSHPAMKDNAPGEVPLWERALAEFHSGTLVDSSSCAISDVLTVADLVLSMYSTTLNEAAVLRLPNIAILYPDYGMKEYRKTTKSDEYPMVSLGCTAKAENHEELKRLVNVALNSDLGLRPAQEKVFNLDGNNALRAANFISGLIS